ncbi:EF-hand domain-containing family member B-like [Ostrinia nubilalis]|uniref:EF-hand domain-containing family member B-like n=1 Tax=Ostrinia nubilalis TaxID=29057 RepID=UPI0030826553
MSKLCGTSGGKGNLGMFRERDPKVCAAGIPSSQATNRVADSLQHYLLQEEVEALIRDSIQPPPKPQKLPPLRHPPKPDMRNSGPFNQVRDIINPPIKTKFQTLVHDFKESVYTSYWKKVVGKVPDPVPTLPQGFDVLSTLGKKLPDCGRLYDIVMPKDPVPDKTPASKQPGYQTNRNYCSTTFNPNKVFGMRANVDPRGKFAKCCLTYDNIIDGTNLKKPINTYLANFQDGKRVELGRASAPNDNISCVPDGYAFGKLKPPSRVVDCLTTCELNPNRELFKKCLGHLNTLRKFMSKRYEGTFFRQLYLSLRYYDKEKTGWLPKELIYEYCNRKFIRFNSSLIEPLLSLWEAFDGAQIKYETFVTMLNFTQSSPEFPKIPDIPDECIDFRTTYTEMVKPGQDSGTKRMAGLPSGRYFDMDYPVTPLGCCKADRVYLPHESDAKSCLCPSLFTLLNVSHRDMYAKREPDLIRKIFEGAGEQFDDEKFNTIWDNAKKYHTEGWVCIETFRRSMEELESAEKEKKA